MARNNKHIAVISPQPNYWLTVASLATVLLLGVIPLFIGLEIPRMVAYIQDNSYIGISFHEEPGEGQKKELGSILSGMENVHQRVDWVSKEKAWEAVQKDFPEMTENPLFSMALVRLERGWDDLAFHHQFTVKVKELDFVDQVYIPPVRFDQIKSNVRLLSFGLGIFSLLALGGAALLIYFTIRLSIYDKRFSIRTLELVGADWAFVQRPFVKRGLRIGLLSAMIASIILLAFVYFWTVQNETAAQYMDWTGLLWSVAVIGILGPFVGLVTSLFTVNRYLQGGLDELFNT